MDFTQVQTMLLALLPQWNYQIVKPFKQLLEEDISLETYYCVKTLQMRGGIMTMSEFGQWTKMPKQQMTKMVNRLVEQQFAERVYDPADRRVIRIRITDNGIGYLRHFVDHDANCFRPFLEQLSREELADFTQALQLLADIFSRMESSTDQVSP